MKAFRSTESPAAPALKDRDLWIIWSASQRVERLKLVVQNRRFLLLAPIGHSPNLASQSLGAAFRALPRQWREHFHSRPHCCLNLLNS